MIKKITKLTFDEITLENNSKVIYEINNPAILIIDCKNFTSLSQLDEALKKISKVSKTLIIVQNNWSPIMANLNLRWIDVEDMQLNKLKKYNIRTLQKLKLKMELDKYELTPAQRDRISDPDIDYMRRYSEVTFKPKYKYIDYLPNNDIKKINIIPIAADRYTYVLLKKHKYGNNFSLMSNFTNAKIIENLKDLKNITLKDFGFAKKVKATNGKLVLERGVNSNQKELMNLYNKAKNDYERFKNAFFIKNRKGQNIREHLNKYRIDNLISEWMLINASKKTINRNVNEFKKILSKFN